MTLVLVYGVYSARSVKRKGHTSLGENQAVLLWNERTRKPQDLKTAEVCAEIAFWYDRGSKTERGIRTHYGLDGIKFSDSREDPCLIDYLATKFKS